MLRMKFEEAQVLWAQGDSDSALQLGQCVIRSLEQNCEQIRLDSETARSQHATMQCLLSEGLMATGLWLKQTQSEMDEEVLEKYLRKGVKIAEKHKHEDLAKMYFAYAEYNDALYIAGCEYEMSAEYTEIKTQHENMKERLKEAEEATKKLKSERNKTARAAQEFKDMCYHVSTLSNRIASHSRQQDDLALHQSNFLLSALKYYAKGIEHSLADDTRALVRFISLWFQNESNPKAQNGVTSLLPKFPSYKLVSLYHQLVSRLGTGTQAFQEALRGLLLRLARDHPHHTLYHLFAIKNANGSAVSGSDAPSQNEAIQRKCDDAKSLLEELQTSQDPTGLLNDMVHSLQQVITAYIELANIPATK